MCPQIKSPQWDVKVLNRTGPWWRPLHSHYRNIRYMCDLVNPEPSERLLCVRTGIINLLGSFSSHSSDDLLPAVSKLNAALQLRRGEAWLGLWPHGVCVREFLQRVCARERFSARLHVWGATTEIQDSHKTNFSYLSIFYCSFSVSLISDSSHTHTHTSYHVAWTEGMWCSGLTREKP